MRTQSTTDTGRNYDEWRNILDQQRTPTVLGSDIPTNTAVDSPNGLVGMNKTQTYNRYKQYRELYSGATADEIVAFIKARPRLPKNKRNAVDRLTYWLEDNGGGFITVEPKVAPRNFGTKPALINHYSPEDVVINTQGAEINAQFKLFIKNKYRKRQPGSGLRRGTGFSYQHTCYGTMESLPACCGCVVISNISKNQLFQDYLIHLAYTMNYGIALCSDVISADKYVYHEWKTVKSFINPRTTKPLIIKTIDIKNNPPIIHPPVSRHPWLIRKQNSRIGHIRLPYLTIH